MDAKKKRSKSTEKAKMKDKEQKIKEKQDLAGELKLIHDLTKTPKAPKVKIILNEQDTKAKIAKKAKKDKKKKKTANGVEKDSTEKEVHQNGHLIGQNGDKDGSGPEATSEPENYDFDVFADTLRKAMKLKNSAGKPEIKGTKRPRDEDAMSGQRAVNVAKKGQKNKGVNSAKENSSGKPEMKGTKRPRDEDNQEPAVNVAKKGKKNKNVNSTKENSPGKTTVKDRKRPRADDDQEPALVEVKKAGKKGKNKNKGENKSVNSAKEGGSIEMGRKYLEWIISPVKTEQFFADSWEQRPLHIKRGNGKYFKDLFSTKELDTILRDDRVLFGKNLDVTSYSVKEGRLTHNPAGRAHAAVVWDMYNNGCSLRMLNPQTFSETVWKGCATLQEFFSSMVGANVYLTPPGTQGFAPHYDDVEVFMLQLEGKKRWRLYEPRTAQEKLPRFSSGNFSQDEIGDPCMDVVMEAGDLIYMPRGTIHQGTCFPDSHSMHITISCHQLSSYGDLLEKMMPAALASAMEEDVDYRKGLPTDYLSYMGVCNSDNEGKQRKAFMKKIEQLVGKLFSYAPVDPAVDQMGKRLMHDALPPYLTPSEKGRCVQGGGEKWNAASSKVVNRVEIDPETEIRLIRANAIRIVTEEEVVRVYYSVDNTREYREMDEQFLEVEADSAPAVEMLARNYPEYTRADELPLKLDEQMKVVQDLWERKLIVTREKLESHYD